MSGDKIQEVGTGPELVQLPWWADSPLGFLNIFGSIDPLGEQVETGLVFAPCGVAEEETESPEAVGPVARFFRAMLGR